MKLPRFYVYWDRTTFWPRVGWMGPALDDGSIVAWLGPLHVAYVPGRMRG